MAEAGHLGLEQSKLKNTSEKSPGGNNAPGQMTSREPNQISPSSVLLRTALRRQFQAEISAGTSDRSALLPRRPRLFGKRFRLKHFRVFDPPRSIRVKFGYRKESVPGVRARVANRFQLCEKIHRPVVAVQCRQA